MVSSTAVLGMVGVILLTVLGSGLADQCDDSGTRDSIRSNIIPQLDSDNVEFKRLIDGSLETIATDISRAAICSKLTIRHNNQNQAFLGVSITSSACEAAFTSPQPADLARWAGKHTFVSGSITGPDNAVWTTPTTSPTITQSMTYCHRGNPCCGAYNEIEETGNKVIGYDPLDDVAGYDCEQGTYVAYPFTVSAEVDCMVKVTGTSAFLECLKHGGASPKKRTSAGYYNVYYAHYNVEDSGSCP